MGDNVNLPGATLRDVSRQRFYRQLLDSALAGRIAVVDDEIAFLCQDLLQQGKRQRTAAQSMQQNNGLVGLCRGRSRDQGGNPGSDVHGSNLANPM